MFIFVAFEMAIDHLPLDFPFVFMSFHFVLFAIHKDIASDRPTDGEMTILSAQIGFSQFHGPTVFHSPMFVCDVAVFSVLYSISAKLYQYRPYTGFFVCCCCEERQS